MESIPSDLIQEILARLPVKDLVRFSCGSNYLKSLISSPDFYRSQKSVPDLDLYGITEQVQFEDPCFTLFDLSNSVDHVSAASVTLDLDAPSGFQPSHLWKVVGSCNGLIALSNVTSIGGARIWNPFTGEFKYLTFCISHNSPITYGFGYNPKIADFKFVRIAAFRGNNQNQMILKTAIYSLKSNFWTKLGKDFCLNCKEKSWTREAGVLANNALHWRICEENGDWKILAFDLVKEEFHYLPVSGCFRFDRWMKLSDLDGCLAATCTYKTYVHVWIMKEYGIKESWKKVFSCPHYEFGYSYNVIPLAYLTRRDKFLFSCDGAWFWYDLRRKEFATRRRRSHDAIGGTKEVKIFQGSLIALNHNTNLVGRRKRKYEEIVSKNC